jgi:hypothetical protein
MQDGALIYNASLLRPQWEAWGIQFLSWPGNSPDLNPIEHIWELLKQRIYKDNKIYTSLNALEAAWYTTGDELSLEDINECILGLPARI